MVRSSPDTGIVSTDPAGYRVVPAIVTTVSPGVGQAELDEREHAIRDDRHGLPPVWGHPVVPRNPVTRLQSDEENVHIYLD
jgi:hypothetical protein